MQLTIKVYSMSRSRRNSLQQVCVKMGFADCSRFVLLHNPYRKRVCR